MNLDDFPFNELIEELNVSQIYSVSEFIEICKTKEGLSMEESVKALHVLLGLNMICPMWEPSIKTGEMGYSQFIFKGEIK